MILGIAGAAAVGSGVALVWWTLARRRARPNLPDDLGYRPTQPAGREQVRTLARLAERSRAGRRVAAGLAAELPRAGVGRSATGFMALVGVGASAAGIALAVAGGPVLGVAAVAVVVAGARFIVYRRARRWNDRFDEELPDALDLMAGSLEAGSSLVQSMELVAAEGQPPLSEELGRVLADTRLGEPLVDALEASAVRVGSEDFAWCVRAVRVQQEFGASLAGLMRTLAQFMRWRQELRREVRALTAEGRVSAYVLVGLPFLMAGFFALVNPGYLALLVTTPLGWILTITATGLMVVGTVWMTRIVKVEV